MYRRLPEKRTGSWGMMVMAVRSAARPTYSTVQYSTAQHSTVKRGQAHPGDVHPVYGDGAGGGLDDAEEGEGDGGLARPRPAHDAHLLPRLEVAAHIPQHQVQTSPVPGIIYNV